MVGVEAFSSVCDDDAVVGEDADVDDILVDRFSITRTSLLAYG